MVVCEERSMTKPRILIVDDEENVRKALMRWFEAGGYDVSAAKDGADAVEMCASNDYDVITMDLEMPRMNGREAIAAIREKRPNVPILILTGYLGDPEGMHNYGAAKVLFKPISLRELEAEVRKVVPRELYAS